MGVFNRVYYIQIIQVTVCTCIVSCAGRISVCVYMYIPYGEHLQAVAHLCDTCHSVITVQH